MRRTSPGFYSCRQAPAEAGSGLARADRRIVAVVVNRDIDAEDDDDDHQQRDDEPATTNSSLSPSTVSPAGATSTLAARAAAAD
jgi:hypothetical protein